MHNSPHLKEVVKEGEIPGGLQYLAEVTTKDEYKCTEHTHEWNWEKVVNMAKMKNFIIDYALKADYDYLFFVDADLVLHPKTLVTLLETQKDIVSEIYWTRFSPDDIEAPNAWDFNQYDFKEGNMEKWRTPGLYPCGMSGACILIHRKVFEVGANYSPIHNIAWWGEDRWFGARSAVHGFQQWIDTHIPPIHLYRESELNKYVENGGYEAAFSYAKP